jgi:hypothetical protein
LRSQRTSWKGDTGFREWRKKRETQIIGVGAGGVIGHHESCKKVLDAVLGVLRSRGNVEVWGL